MVLAHESFVLACFLRISKHNVWILLQLLPMRTHARIQKVLSEGSNSDNVFFPFFFRGEMIQISLKSGHHRHPSETPFKWRFAGVPMMALMAFRWGADEMAFRWGADDGPTLNAGLVTLRISGDPVQYC